VRQSVDALRLIRCGLGDETYALDMARVRGIEHTTGLRRADAPGGVVGYLPGPVDEVPVLSLADRLGRPSSVGLTGQHIVVLGGAGGPWGLLVERVSQVTPVAGSAVAALPPLVVNPEARVFRGLVQIDAEWLLLLAPERLGPAPESEGTWQPAPPPAAPDLTALRNRRQAADQLILFPAASPERGRKRLSFGLSVAQVLEVSELVPILPVPLAPDHVRGLVQWRGLALPVLDLAGRLRLPPTDADRKARLVIAYAGRDAGVAAFLVRSPVRMLPLPVPHQPCDRPLSPDPALTFAAFDLRGETVVVPDLAGACAARPTEVPVAAAALS
jgi:chemotaxis signal transduction protein